MSGPVSGGCEVVLPADAAYVQALSFCAEPWTMRWASLRSCRVFLVRGKAGTMQRWFCARLIRELVPVLVIGSMLDSMLDSTA